MESSLVVSQPADDTILKLLQSKAQIPTALKEISLFLRSIRFKPEYEEDGKHIGYSRPSLD